MTNYHNYLNDFTVGSPQTRTPAASEANDSDKEWESVQDNLTLATNNVIRTILIILGG